MLDLSEMSEAAALPQHIAVSLRLTGETGEMILRLCLRRTGGVATVKLTVCDGKPEAFRNVLRQSRSPLLPFDVVPQGWLVPTLSESPRVVALANARTSDTTGIQV